VIFKEIKPTEKLIHVEMDLTKAEAAELLFRIDTSPATGGMSIQELWEGLNSFFGEDEYRPYYDKFCKDVGYGE